MDVPHVPGARVVIRTLEREASARRLLDGVVDPEIPVVTITDLGIVRDVEVEGSTVTVTVTPTYSGCPAMETIRADIISVLSRAGFDRVDVTTVYAPAWSTDWITTDGRRKLRDFGIAPPRDLGPDPIGPVVCPRCSGESVTVSEFGSTACKALLRCVACLEPFDHFKEI